MQKYRQTLVENLLPLMLFVMIAVITYAHVEQSIGVVKYHLHWGIKNLLDNYALYHQSFLKFILQTSSFHTGDSEAEWRTFFYLWPLYAFSDALGGLSLKTVCLFTVTSSLIFLGLFYSWIKTYWGRQTAFFAALMLGFSSIFQEIARSGSYDAYSFLIAIIWALLCFKAKENEKASYYFWLGLMTGCLWYGYSLLRPLTLVAVAWAFWASSGNKFRSLGLLLLGIAVVVFPAVLVLIAQSCQVQQASHLMFIDRENIFDYSQGSPVFFGRILMDNLGIFMHRILGDKQLIEPFVVDRTHAALYNIVLGIPMMIGAWDVFKQRRLRSNQILVILSVMIFVPPLFTSSLGYMEARRSLLYIIPLYVLIGLGLKRIWKLMARWRPYSLRLVLIAAFIFMIILVVAVERSLVGQYVLSSKRDVGLLSFAEKIKQRNLRGVLFYIDGRSIYIYTWESDIMRAALMEKGRSVMDVYSASLFAQIPFNANDFYVATGSAITVKDFDAWCKRNKLADQLILKSPIINSPQDLDNQEFKFYIVHRLA